MGKAAENAGLTFASASAWPLPAARTGQVPRGRGAIGKPIGCASAPSSARRTRRSRRASTPTATAGASTTARRAATLRRHGPQVRHGPVAPREGHHLGAGRGAPPGPLLRAVRRHLRVRGPELLGPWRSSTHPTCGCAPATTAPTNSSRSKAKRASCGHPGHRRDARPRPGRALQRTRQGHHDHRVQRSRLELPHGFKRSSAHFIDALLNGTAASLTPEEAVKVLQLCFAVYLAGETHEAVDPRLMTGSVTPTGWADW